MNKFSTRGTGVRFGGKRLLAEADRLRKLLDQQIAGCDRLEAELSRSELALEVKGQSAEVLQVIVEGQGEIRLKLKQARLNIAQSQALADTVEKSALKVVLPTVRLQMECQTV